MIVSLSGSCSSSLFVDVSEKHVFLTPAVLDISGLIQSGGAPQGIILSRYVVECLTWQETWLHASIEFILACPNAFPKFKIFTSLHVHDSSGSSEG